MTPIQVVYYNKEKEDYTDEEFITSMDDLINVLKRAELLMWIKGMGNVMTPSQVKLLRDLGTLMERLKEDA